MADPIREAMKRIMLENKPNSGTKPPNLTVTEDSHKNCGTCIHFSGMGLCKLFSYRVTPSMVCDEWSPQKE